MTKIVNISRHEPYDVLIGRTSIFGNPYVIGIDGDRAEVIRRYKIWFDFLIKDPIFRKEVLKLKDKTLGCFCKQKDKEVQCHGDVIVDYLDKISFFDEI